MHQTAPQPPARFPNAIEDMVGALIDADDRDVIAARLQERIDAGEQAKEIATAAVERLRYQGEIRFDIVADQDGQDFCGCGGPIVHFRGEWLHVYNPYLTGTDDHDARPGR